MSLPVLPPSASATPRPRPPVPPPAAIPPLLPVVLTLVVAAIGLSLVFAWRFPAQPRKAEAVPVARFTDVTDQSGVHFVQRAGNQEAPTTLGGAVAVLDYNRDGAPDLFFVNGTAWPWEDQGAWTRASACALYRNDGRGHFTEVSQEAGADLVIQGMGVTVGDYDNDGFPDIFVTAVGSNHLLHNRGDGTFADVAIAAGVAGDDQTWSTGATWLDFDHDGKLDLVVAHYARWPQEVPLAMAFSIADIGRSYGAPTGFLSVPPTLYRNLGGGKFSPVPGAAGLRDIDPQTGLAVGQPLAVMPVDANGDGRLDLLFTYHANEPSLFLDQGDGSFAKWRGNADARHEGATAGFASASLLPYDETERGDSRLSVLQAAAAPGSSVSGPAALLLASKGGAAIFDYEFDGRFALFSGEGRAEPGLNKFGDGRAFAHPPQLYVERQGRWLPAAASPDGALTNLLLTARGVASADLDGDGDSDLVIAQHQGPAILLRNDQRSGLPWLRLHLVATRSQPDAGGARVEVHTPRRVLRRTVVPAMGFMAQSESALTFGLGDDARVRKIVIQWPSGQRQELRAPALDQTLTVREP